MYFWTATTGIRARIAALCARAAIIIVLALFGSLLDHHAALANPVVATAAQRANAGLSACSSNSGPTLYRCVSNVLARMCGDLSAANVPEAKGVLHVAATRLQAAVSKVQALSAITQTAALIGRALARARTIGAPVPGWGEASGLGAIAGVLSRAAALIQQKG